MTGPQVCWKRVTNSCAASPAGPSASASRATSAISSARAGTRSVRGLDRRPHVVPCLVVGRPGRRQVRPVDPEGREQLDERLAQRPPGRVAQRRVGAAHPQAELGEPVDLGDEHVAQHQVLRGVDDLLVRRAAAGLGGPQVGERLLAGGVDEDPEHPVERVVAGGAGAAATRRAAPRRARGSSPRRPSRGRCPRRASRRYPCGSASPSGWSMRSPSRTPLAHLLAGRAGASRRTPPGPRRARRPASSRRRTGGSSSSSTATRQWHSR